VSVTFNIQIGKLFKKLYLFILQQLLNKYKHLILIFLVVTDDCVCVVFVREETGFCFFVFLAFDFCRFCVFIRVYPLHYFLILIIF